MGVMYTRTADGTLKPVHTVHVITGEGLDTTVTEFNQMNDLVTAYLAAADAAYTDDNGDSVSVIADYETNQGNADRPVGYPLSITGYGTLYVQNELHGDGWAHQAKGGDVVRGYVLNAIPGEVSQYLVKNYEGNQLLANGRIKPTGKVRMIRFYGLHRNFRDLGGWNCDGGTVKYGKLFRSAAPGYVEEWIDPVIAKNIGIRHQIDLRNEASHVTASPFGSEIHYHRFPIVGPNYFKHTIKLDSADLENAKKTLRTIFDAAEHNEGLLYHCSLGRDRTGTITILILALLGVAKRDIDKDYEISSFSGYDPATIYGARRNGAGYAEMFDYLDTFNGTSLRNNVVRWFVSAGFTLDELNAFRSAMIDGEPDVLTEDIIEGNTPEEPDVPAEYEGNLVPTATEAPYGDVILDGCGYRNGYYCSSGGASVYSPDAACVTTGNIPVTVTYSKFPVIYIKGISIDTTNSHHRFYVNNPDGTIYSVNLFNNPSFLTLTELGDMYYKVEFVKNADGQVVLTEKNIAAGDISFRLSGEGTGENLIVTIDQPIE